MKHSVGAHALLSAPLLAGVLMLSGCMGSPTYGTGKTANAQLASDLTGMFSMKPRNTVSDYSPRPELVKPASMTDLPAPQDSVASADNPAWPVSPEQKRAKLRARATANQNNPNFEPEIENDMPVKDVASVDDGMTPAQRQDYESSHAPKNLDADTRDALKRRKVSRGQGDPTKRKYLSEPPLEYRVPAATAATDDLGEDELKKERRLKKMAQGKKGWSWRDLVPGI